MSLPGLQKNHSLAQYTWWKVGGPAEYFVAPETEEQLKEALTWAYQNDLEVTPLSGGSNVLVSDDGIKGLVVYMTKLRGVEVSDLGDRLYITALAGTPKSDLAKVFLERKLPPAVFLTGIPGDVGGGIVMNAGIGEQREPREFCEITDWVEVMRWGQDGNGPEVVKLKFNQKDLQWDYRHTGGWQPGVMVKAGFSWTNHPSAETMSEVRAATKKRVATQPLNQPSGGSTFRNPPGEKAAKLIEQCGLKAFKIGGAEVSQKHSNFIVNDGTAKAADVAAVINHVQTTVKEQTGVSLVREVIFLGW